MPCLHLPRLEANARSSIVVLKRPCTFLVALILSALSLLTSAFFSFTHLQPPSCPSSASDYEPRTRRRPVVSARASPSRPTPSEDARKTALESFVAAFRAAPTRPPPSRRASGRVAAVGFSYHELDELTEAREEEEEAEQEQRGRAEESARGQSPDLFAPSLTPDTGSENDTDGTSEVDTLDDECRHHSSGGKAKGLAIFTGLRFRRTPSSTETKVLGGLSPTSTSPGELNRPSSPATSTHSASSASSFAARCPIQRRKRAATHAGGPRQPTSSLANAPPLPRRQFSDPSLPSPPSSTSSSLSTANSQLSLDVPLGSLSGNAPGRKRSVSSLFRTPFRSLSPLGRSPLTTPEPSPPPSPTMSSFASATVQRIPSLNRKNPPRARSPAPQKPPMMRRRVSDGVGADLSGVSGLALSDVLR